MRQEDETSAQFETKPVVDEVPCRILIPDPLFPISSISLAATPFRNSIALYGRRERVLILICLFLLILVSFGNFQLIFTCVLVEITLIILNDLPSGSRGEDAPKR